MMGWRQTGQLDPVIDLTPAAGVSQAPSFGGASGMDRMSAFDNLNSAFGDVLPQAAVPQVKTLVPKSAVTVERKLTPQKHDLIFL